MSKSVWSWTIFISIINLLAIFYLRHWVISDGSDKSIILFWVFYPLIIIVNGLAWLLLRKTNLKNPLKKIVIALLILFFPLLFTI